MGLWAGPSAGLLAQNSGGKAIPPGSPFELFFFSSLRSAPTYKYSHFLYIVRLYNVVITF